MWTRENPHSYFCVSAFTGSPHYSMDFEDEESVKESGEEVCSYDKTQAVVKL